MANSRWRSYVRRCQRGTSVPVDPRVSVLSGKGAVRMTGADWTSDAARKIVAVPMTDGRVVLRARPEVTVIGQSRAVRVSKMIGNRLLRGTIDAYRQSSNTIPLTCVRPPSPQFVGERAD